MSIGQQPNDLLDQRDQLLNQLSRLIPPLLDRERQRLSQFLGRQQRMVLGNNTLTMTTNTNAAGDATVLWTTSNTAIAPTGGEINGLITARDGRLASQQAAHYQLIRR